MPPPAFVPKASVIGPVVVQRTSVYASTGAAAKLWRRAIKPKLMDCVVQSLEALRGRTIAIPGKLTTAYLTLQLCLGKDVPVVVMPFDQILPAVADGRVEVKGVPPGATLLFSAEP